MLSGTLSGTRVGPHGPFSQQKAERNTAEHGPLPERETVSVNAGKTRLGAMKKGWKKPGVPNRDGPADH